MPEIKLSQVMSFTSEDPNFPVKNLLGSESFKKWKCKSAGEKEAAVVLKFENSSQIEAVHVGNEGSAFVEILVGKLGDDVKNFQVLLPTSSFMSPVEARNSTSTSRVRLFEREKLSSAALDRPWDCARVVCTQPFCRTLAYGLAFVKFRSPEEAARPAADGAVQLGAFTLRPDTGDDIAAGGLFRRRGQLTAAAGGSLKREDRTDRVVPPRHPPSAVQLSSEEPPRPTNHYQLKPETKQKPPESRPRPAESRQKKPPEIRPARTETKPAVRPDGAGTSSPAALRPDKAPPRAQKVAGATASADPPTRNGATPARPPATAIYRPLNKLLSGVVFAMSGYKNPERATLREQAVRLGASYRPDWGPDCTHLICAFRNTPKAAQVRGRGRIVGGDWVAACAAQKRRVPWRRHALDPADGRAPDSGDEIWAEELRPRPPAAAAAADIPSSSQPADDDYGGSTDEMDTDDEIRMVQTSMTPAAGPAGPAKTSAGSSSATADSPQPGPSSAGTQRPRPSPSSSAALSSAGTQRPRPSPSSSAALSSGGTQRPRPSPSSSAAPSSSAGSRRRSSSSPPAAPPAKRPAAAADATDSDEAYDAETDEDEPADERRPDTSGLSVPELPDFLAGKTFLLYGDAMSAESRRRSARYITAYGGKLEQYFGKGIDYVITADPWDDNFDEALSDCPQLMFARPSWLDACHRKGRLVPPQAYLVTADL